MAIWARKPESDFRPAPEGLHQGVCVDVIDLGLVDTPFGQKHKGRFRWQIDSRDEDSGRRYAVQQDYTLSLHERANLRKHLESWRGRSFTEPELAGFDLEAVVGVNCQIQVVHNIGKNGSVWANVQAIVPINSRMTKIQPEDYVREKDRAKDQETGGKPLETHDDEEDPCPF